MEGNCKPVKMNEIKSKAENVGISGESARKRAYDLKDKGIVEKYNKTSWVRTGRFRKLSESKLKNLFVVVALLYLVSTLFVRNPWPIYISATLLVISVLLFW